MYFHATEANKDREWETQSGQITSNQKESWICSVSTIGNSDLIVLNLISEQKAFFCDENDLYQILFSALF